MHLQPYYQPSPAPPAPFTINSVYSDPSFASDSPMAWAINVAISADIVIFGAGFYSFFKVSLIIP
jgi:glucan 1,3-beta-glucosidase